jgi:hypothetical protein
MTRMRNFYTVPRYDLYDIDAIPGGDELFPSPHKQPVVTSVDPLHLFRQHMFPTVVKIDHIFIPTVRSIMLFLIQTHQYHGPRRIRLTVKNQGETAAINVRSCKCRK